MFHHHHHRRRPPHSISITTARRVELWRIALVVLLTTPIYGLRIVDKGEPSTSSHKTTGGVIDELSGSEPPIGIDDDQLSQLHPDTEVHTNQFTVEMTGGPEVAQRVARQHGFTYLGQLFGDYYHLMKPRLARRSLLETGGEESEPLESHPLVRGVERQTLKKRVKRDYVPPVGSHGANSHRLDAVPYYAANNIRHYQESNPPLLPFHIDPNEMVQSGDSTRVKFDDPQWPRMWYLNRGNNLDMHVVEAWEKNITGAGVVVTILDDGLEKDHPDLVTNYDPDASFDVNGFDEDPMPRYDIIDSNRHGTRCAGEVAANANNSVCAVGVAFNAKVGGIRMLDGDVTDAVEARSLGFNPQHIHIYSASWGPDDDGRTVDGPGKMAAKAFENGIKFGRNGRGSIFVWASGNGGREKDNCNCDGYTNSIFTLSISSATEKGSIPWYSEACSSTLASTYSSGSFGERQIVTTDLHHGCTSSHTGTSASAPLAAGICALALQANPNLTWRDMQHIVVLSARRKNLEGSWTENGAGLNVSHWFGYGLINASAMVDYSRQWVTVPEQKKCIFKGKIHQLSKNKNTLSYQLNVSCSEVRYLEHVQVLVNLTTPKRGDVEIIIRSPSGTHSTLLTKRPKDNSGLGFANWPFMTVHFWGESPNGIWTLIVNNTGRHNNTALHGWSLVMHGTREFPFVGPFYPKRRLRDHQEAPAVPVVPPPSSSSGVGSTLKPPTLLTDLTNNRIDSQSPVGKEEATKQQPPQSGGENIFLFPYGPSQRNQSRKPELVLPEVSQDLDGEEDERRRLPYHHRHYVQSSTLDRTRHRPDPHYPLAPGRTISAATGAISIVIWFSLGFVMALLSVGVSLWFFRIIGITTNGSWLYFRVRNVPNLEAAIETCR